MTATKRETRAEQQARTRERILAAAAEAFLEGGFVGTTVAQITARAGFTVGAVYSNFANKEDLFLEVSDRYVQSQVEVFVRLFVPATSLDDLLDRVVGWYAGMLADEREWAVLNLEFALQVRGKPALADRLRLRRQALEDGLAAILTEQARRFGVTPPLDTRALATAIVALGDGLEVRQLLDPGGDAVAVFEQALRILLFGC